MRESNISVFTCVNELRNLNSCFNIFQNITEKNKRVHNEGRKNFKEFFDSPNTIYKNYFNFY